MHALPETLLAARLPLAADLKEILGAIVPIVAFLLWIIVQVLGKGQQAGGGQAKPAVPPRKRPREDALTTEIDEFLTEARRRRTETAQPEPPRRPVAETFVEPPRQRPRRPTKTAAPIEAVLVPDDVGGENVAEHVKKHLDTSKFKTRANALGDRVEDADDDMEAHLRQVFDHRVGRLGTAPSSAAVVTTAAVDASTTVSSDLATRLTNPQQIRDVIIFNEIIMRPEGRWE
ncbi:MAG: hypothetical protein WD176_04970 [Pirellulales bacterium]